MSLEKVLRLAGPQQQSTGTGAGDALRELVQAANLSLSEACTSADPAQAAELILAAAGIVENLASLMFTEGMPDWVEATAADPDSLVALGGDAPGNGNKPYGNVSYADPGYQGDGKKRYPVDTEEHTRAAWSYINKAKNAGRYSATQLASIKSKIKSAMSKHGIGANVTASAVHEEPVLAAMAAGEVLLARMPKGGSGPVVAMHHAPMRGTHEHPHMVAMVHSHRHEHRGDSSHDGGSHAVDGHDGEVPPQMPTTGDSDY